MWRSWLHWFSQLRRRWFPPRTLGQRGEDLAAKFLKRLGYKIIARQVRFSHGELDIVAVDGRTVVFVEVKTRASHDKGEPAEAIDSQKQRQLTRVALLYLKRHGLLAYASRFDVVAITWGDHRPPVLEHIKNAFQAVGENQFFS